jgi:hypothetical protein
MISEMGNKQVFLWAFAAIIIFPAIARAAAIDMVSF